MNGASRPGPVGRRQRRKPAPAEPSRAAAHRAAERTGRRADAAPARQAAATPWPPAVGRRDSCCCAGQLADQRRRDLPGRGVGAHADPLRAAEGLCARWRYGLVRSVVGAVAGPAVRPLGALVGDRLVEPFDVRQRHPGQVRAPQVAAGERGPTQIGGGEHGVAKDAAGEVRARHETAAAPDFGEVGADQRRVPQPGAGQIGADEPRAAQVGAGEVGEGERRLLREDARHTRPPAVETDQPGAGEVRPLQRGRHHAAAAEVGLLEMGVAEVGAVEAGLDQAGPLEPRPRAVASRRSQPKACRRRRWRRRGAPWPGWPTASRNR